MQYIINENTIQYDIIRNIYTDYSIIIYYASYSYISEIQLIYCIYIKKILKYIISIVFTTSQQASFFGVSMPTDNSSSRQSNKSPGAMEHTHPWTWVSYRLYSNLLLFGIRLVRSQISFLEVFKKMCLFLIRNHFGAIICSLHAPFASKGMLFFFVSRLLSMQPSRWSRVSLWKSWHTQCPYKLHHVSWPSSSAHGQK